MKNKLPDFWSFNRIRDTSLIQREDLLWHGPYAWPGYEQVSQLQPVPDRAAVYLFTFEYVDGFIVRSVGVTNSLKRRLAEHTRNFKNGSYTVLDVYAAKNGVRKEWWHGWEYAKMHRDIFLDNKEIILELVESELMAYRLFIGEMADRRKRERMEAAILINAYHSMDSVYDLIDRGMALKGRNNFEIPILIKNSCSYKLYGISDWLEI